MLEIVPITLKEANQFVFEKHRHHKKPIRGCKFCLGVSDGEKIVGVAIIGRPVARFLDDGWTLEVNRCCTDGTKNACSILYSRAWKITKALGYKKLITYVLNNEIGTSLKAVGWRCLGKAGGGEWNRKSRPRIDLHPTQIKLKWEAI